MLNEEHIEEMLAYAQAHGVDDLCIRMDMSLVLGPKKIRLFAVEGDPALLKASFEGFAGKWETAKAQLQQVVKELNEAETTEAKAR